jgi:phage FluMu gp28-like protein
MATQEVKHEIKYNRPFMYEYQKQILNSTARFTVTLAATKCGKTASHIVWLFEEALKCTANQSVWWVAPSFSQAKMAYDRMKTQIFDKQFSVHGEKFFTVNETNLIITLFTGAKIAFKTGEKPDNLYGDDVYAFIFDEFPRAREAAWFALRSTITSTGGKGKFIGNASSNRNWGTKLAMMAKSGEDKDFEFFRITAYDAAAAGMMTKDGRPLLEEIESAKRALPEAIFKMLYLAETSEDGSNPFGTAYIQQCTYPLSSEPAVCYGIDLAKSFDYTVIIGLDKRGSVCHYERFQRDWRDTTQAITDLPKQIPIAIDSTGVGDPIAEDVARHMDNVELFKFSEKSKQQIMEGLALGIQKRMITFPEGTIKDELESFEYEFTRSGVRYSAPSGDHDDCVCALALAWHKWQSASMMTDGPSVW